ncbi:MAG: PLP-dependent transferase, partial [Acidobacteriota bacterium]
MEHRKESLETLIVHGDHKLDPLTGSISPPIYAASTFAFKSAQHGAEMFADHRRGYYYTRVANPTIDHMCKRMALLEGGETAIAFASGMAAIHAVFIALAGAGDSFV